MPNSSTIPTTGRTQATQTLYNNVVKDAIRLLAAAGSNKTIATGAIAVTPSAGESHYQVDTQASAADDDLDSITGGATGDIIALVSASSARVVTLRSGAGNILLKDGANITLDPTQSTMLRYNGTNWTPYGGSSGQETNNLTNRSGSTRAAGDVVIFDTTNATSYTTTTIASDLRVCGVVKSSTANAAAGPLYNGAGQVVTVNVDTAAVAIGQFLVSSTTAGRATAGSYYREPAVFAVALSSKSAGSNGTVSAMLIDNYRQAIIGTSGWNLGGWNGAAAVTTSQKFTMASETWAAVAGAALPAGRHSNSGMGYGTTAAYAVMGSNTSTYAGGQNNRYKIAYSTETASTLTATVGTYYFGHRSCINFATKAFTIGGQNTAAASTNLSYKTTGATDAEAGSTALTSTRMNVGGVSDGTYAYVEGDSATTTWKLDTATESVVDTAGAYLGTAIAGYCHLSFPASAGYRLYKAGGTTYSRKLTFSTATDANHASSPTGDCASGFQVTDGIALAYAGNTAAANKLPSSTGTYSTIANYPSATLAANASYGAL